LSKPYASNASSSDHFNGASSVYLSSSWGDVSMTSYDRQKRCVFIETIARDKQVLIFLVSVSGLSSASAFSTQALANPFLVRSINQRPYPNATNAFNGNCINPHGVMRSLQPPFPRYGQQYGVEAFGGAANLPPSDMPENKGPAFSDTQVTEKVYNRHNEEVHPDIVASIQKGFFKVDEKWTCYRRNYFAVNCSFVLKSHNDSPLYIAQHGQLRQIHGWSVSISAKTQAVANQASESRGLVQHTPKRKKSTESVPGRACVQPQLPHALNQHHHHNHHHHHSHHQARLPGHHGASPPLNDHYYNPVIPQRHIWDAHVPAQAPTPSSHTFERIQFQKATANNGKRRAQQQFFHVVVELSANTTPDQSEDRWVMVAEKVSDPIVVRGRSPGHYKDNQQRRDSQANMDPDRGAGNGHDGGWGGHHNGYGSMPNYNQYDEARSHHHHYGSGTQRSYLVSSNDSPSSCGSGATLNGSPVDAEFSASDSETLQPTKLYGQISDAAVTEARDEPLFSMSRKRSLEDDSNGDGLPYQYSTSLCDTTTTSSIDYPAFSRSKILCA
jgi:hypothetical protein